MVALKMPPHGNNPPIPIRLDNLDQMGHVRTIGEARGEALMLAWHPTAALLTTCDEIVWWDTFGHRVASVRGRHGQWSASGEVFVYVLSGTVQAWRKTGNQRTTVFIDDTPVVDPKLSPTAEMLAVMSRDRGIRLMPLDGTSPIVLPTSEQPGVWKGQWSSDGSAFSALIGAPGEPTLESAVGTTLAIWNRHGVLTTRVEGLPPTVHGPFWRPQHHALTVVGERDVVGVDSNGLTVYSALAEPPRPWAEPIAWTPSGSHVAIMHTRTVVIVNPVTHEHAALNSGVDVAVASLAWHPTQPILAVGSWDSTIRLWSLEGHLLHAFETSAYRRGVGTPFVLRWSPDGRMLAASLRDGAIHLYGIRDAHQENEQRR